MPCLLPSRQLGSEQLSEREIRRRIMTLNHDRSRLDAQTFTRVGIGLACVGPIRHLIAINPYSDVGTASDDRLREPFLVIGDNPACVLASKDATGSTVLWFGADLRPEIRSESGSRSHSSVHPGYSERRCPSSAQERD